MVRSNLILCNLPEGNDEEFEPATCKRKTEINYNPQPGESVGVPEAGYVLKICSICKVDCPHHGENLEIVIPDKIVWPD